MNLKTAKYAALCPFFLKVFSLLFVLGLLGIQPSSATIRYIKNTPSGLADGTSWTNASADIQTMLNISSTGDELWVAYGTYHPTQLPPTAVAAMSGDPRYQTFMISDGVKLYGSFFGTETAIDQRNILANPTILSGDIGVAGDSSDNCFHVVMASAADTGGIGVTIDGFTVENGNANDFTSVSFVANGNIIYGTSGGGIMVVGGINTISNNIIRHNLAYTQGAGILTSKGRNTINYNNIHDNSYSLTSGTMHGAGISTSHGYNEISNNVIYNNTSSMAGGGIYTAFGHNAVKNNVLYENSALGQGAAIYADQGVDTISNNYIHNNSANFAGGVMTNFDTDLIENNFISFNLANINGGGIYNQYGINEVFNNVLYDNQSSGNGGGIYLGTGANTVENNTFYNNAATVNGGALYTNDTGATHIANSIFRNNTQAGSNAVSGADIYNNGSYNYVSYCITQQNSLYSSGIGIINNVDPLFTNSSNPLGPDNMPGTVDDGLSLSTASPALNSGTSAGALNTDIIGTSRPQGGQFDMGAYERPSPLHTSPNTAIYRSGSVFPNPASKTLRIGIEGKIISMRITDAEGRLVKESLSPESSVFEIGDLLNGYYSVTVKTEYNESNYPLIIHR